MMPSLLSPELLQYYTKYGLEEMETFFKDKVQDGSCKFPLGSRFIRLNPRYHSIDTLKRLKDELPKNTSPKEILWLGSKMGFFSIPSDFPLYRSQCFTSGRIYGMDVSSGAAVAALLFNDFDYDKSEVLDTNIRDKPFRVMDLCCAPGLKLCTMADLLQSSSYYFNPTCEDQVNLVDLIGVDVCPQRMSLCKNILCKYHIHSDTRGTLFESPKRNINIQLFCTDSTKLGEPYLSLNPSTLVFDSNIALTESFHAGKRKRMNKSARTRERKQLREVFVTKNCDMDYKGCIFQKQQDDLGMNHWLDSFDRILIDAECSTDGAISHWTHKLKSIDDSESQLFNEKLSDPDQLCRLLQLQKNLILSGFKLLRPGGKLVYSTCSLSTEQNEDIVTWLINQFPSTAFLIPLRFDQADETRVKEGELPGTIRFTPKIKMMDNSDKQELYGGGFFLAKIGKKTCEGNNI